MTDSTERSRVRRPVVVTAILLVAVAVILAVLQAWFAGQPDDVDGGASLASEQATVPEPESIVDARAVAVPVTAEAPASAPAPSGIVRVVVLPARVATADPTTEVVVDAVNRAMVSTLRSSTKVDLIELSLADLAGVVPSNAGVLNEDNIVALAVVRRYAADVVAEISERSLPDSPVMALNLQASQANGSRFNEIGGLSKNGDAATRELAFLHPDPQSLGVHFAERILRHVGQVSLSSRVPPEVRTTLLDASRPERERLQALFELGNSGGFVQDGETLAAVIDLGTRSQSADTRAMAWGLLRRMAFDPAVAPALSASLLSDPDPGVRREAALALGAYRGDNSYQQTLAYASRNDSSLDVRIAAQISMMDREQQRTFARERLLDRDLTPAERLGPTALLSREPRSDPSASLTAGNIQMPDALALAEIVSLTDDPALKVRGLAELQRTFSATAVRSGGRPTPEITRVMIDSTKNEEISVRRQALSALLPLSDDPEVRAVLESVVANEPELAARVRIPEALARVQ